LAKLTEAQLNQYLDRVKRWLTGKENASVQITIRGGRLNVSASDDEILVQNGKILGEDGTVWIGGRCQ